MRAAIHHLAVSGAGHLLAVFTAFYPPKHYDRMDVTFGFVPTMCGYKHKHPLIEDDFCVFERRTIMIYKVLFQPNKIENPRRENTRSIYLEAESSVAARALVEEKTEYNIELIQEVTGDFLEYEQKSPDFKITEL